MGCVSTTTHWAGCAGGDCELLTSLAKDAAAARVSRAGAWPLRSDPAPSIAAMSDDVMPRTCAVSKALNRSVVRAAAGACRMVSRPRHSSWKLRDPVPSSSKLSKSAMAATGASALNRGHTCAMISSKACKVMQRAEAVTVSVPERLPKATRAPPSCATVLETRPCRVSTVACAKEVSRERRKRTTLDLMGGIT